MKINIENKKNKKLFQQHRASCDLAWENHLKLTGISVFVNRSLKIQAGLNAV